MAKSNKKIDVEDKLIDDIKIDEFDNKLNIENRDSTKLGKIFNSSKKGIGVIDSAKNSINNLKLGKSIFMGYNKTENKYNTNFKPTVSICNTSIDNSTYQKNSKISEIKNMNETKFSLNSNDFLRMGLK